MQIFFFPQNHIKCKCFLYENINFIFPSIFMSDRIHTQMPNCVLFVLRWYSSCSQIVFQLISDCVLAVFNFLLFNSSKTCLIRHLVNPLLIFIPILTFSLFVRNPSHCLFRIIANHGFEFASFLSNPWINNATFACLITLKLCMNHINQSKFIRAKFTRRTRNWIATRIHKHVISLGRKRSQRSCIFDWKQANVTRWTHGWWKRESMRITRGLPTMHSVKPGPEVKCHFQQ